MNFKHKKENDTDLEVCCHSLNRIGGNIISIFILPPIEKNVKKW